MAQDKICTRRVFSEFGNERDTGTAELFEKGKLKEGFARIKKTLRLSSTGPDVCMIFD